MKMMTSKNGYKPTDFFDDFFYPYSLQKQYQTNFMKTDITKRKGNYVFDIDIPGYKKDDIKVKLKDGYLTVEVDTTKDTQCVSEEECKWLHQERFSGEYSRSFYLGCTNETKVNATYHNGVLTVVVPDEENCHQDTTKYISIE